MNRLLRRDTLKRKGSAKPAEGLNVYDVIKTVGEGSEGKCDLLRRVHDGKKIICKTTHSSRERYKGGELPIEVTILQDLLRPHPRIIDLISYSPNNGKGTKAYYEYCSGGDLHSQLRKGGGSSEAWIWHVFKQMAEALAYLHLGYECSRSSRSGSMPPDWIPIVHCDIKPDNIFLAEPRTMQNPLPNLVLGDFGLAAIEGDKKGHGCKAFKPPEWPVNSPASDIYALGCTIFEMGYGHPPVLRIPKGFRGTEDEGVLRGDAKDVRALPIPLYSADLSRVMLECLNPRPSKRIDAYDLLKEIRGYGPR